MLLNLTKTEFNWCYDIGALNAFELDQNRVQLVNAEANLINAKFDFVFKTKVLDFYMGNKIVD